MSASMEDALLGEKLIPQTNTVADRESPGEPAAQAVSGRGRRARLNGAAVATAAKLLPLVKLLDTIQPHVASESVFHTRRLKIQAHLAVVYAELKLERPKREALSSTFHSLAELVREETHDISKDELRQAAKEVVLATLRHAPALINAAHQARLLA